MSVSSSRLTGIFLVAGGVVAFGAAYSWLLGARAEQIVGQTGFGVGLLISLAMVLPTMAAGIHLAVHGDPDVETHRKREAVKRAIGDAREGWADLWTVMETTELRRGDLAEILVEQANEAGFACYVDWRKGALIAWPPTAPADKCPSCGEALPPDLVPGDACAGCRVAIVRRPQSSTARRFSR